MGAVHAKIKKFRIDGGYTQVEMAGLLNIHEKTWAKIENGITRLDLERLHQIASVFEIPIEDLINTEDGVYISEIKENKVGFNNSQVTIHDGSEIEKKLHEKLLVKKIEQ